jgi:hypothetical protein
MIERIRTVIKTEYEVQLLSLASTTTATTVTATATVTNSSVNVNSSTTIQMNNGCTNIDIGYHVLLILILSSSRTLLYTSY